MMFNIMIYAISLIFVYLFDVISVTPSNVHGAEEAAVQAKRVDHEK